jgi:uncharacterized protein
MDDLLNRVPNPMILGIVGSTAYGLANEHSDVDRVGVFAQPTADLLRLSTPKDTHTTTDPDVTFHEARKYLKLALAGNPTIMELLWLPQECYEHVDVLGVDLISIRSQLLSAPRVRDAYMGYAQQQFHKLELRGDGSFSADTRKRTAKHARHLARLVKQGFELYERGTLAVKLENPEWFIDFGEDVARGFINRAVDLMDEYKGRFDTTPSCLPDSPNTKAAERWLARVRRTFS